MRLAITHFKLRSLFQKEAKRPDVKKEVASEHVCDGQYLRALQGFVMLLDSSGEILYVSDDVSKYLGLSQLDLLGQSVFEFSHPCDHDETKEMLSDAKNQNEQTVFIRMKCTLTNKGRNMNIKSATYKVIKCSGYMQTEKNSKLQLQLSNTGPAIRCMSLVCSPVPHPSNIDVPLDIQTFLSCHSLNMKFTYVDDRVNKLLGFEAADLIDKSLFEYHHNIDTKRLSKSFTQLMSKGQTETNMYRFLAKTGGYVWAQTQATVIYNKRTEKPDYVVCVNYVLSGIQDPDIQLSLNQIQCKASEESFVEPYTSLNLDEKLITSTGIFYDEPTVKNDEKLFPIIETALKTSGNEIKNKVPFSEDIETDIWPAGAVDKLVDEMDILGEVCESTQHELPFMLSLNREATPSPVPTSPASDTAGLNDDCYPVPSVLGTEEIQQLPAVSSTDSLTLPDTLIEEMQESNLEMRVPFIPMDEDEDYNLTSFSVPKSGQTEDENMLGTTESVFAPNPDESKSKVNGPLPMFILKQLAQQNSHRLPGKDIERNAGPPKMKRPMETNRLETGPPVLKRICADDVEKCLSPDSTTNLENFAAQHTSPPVSPCQREVTSSTDKMAAVNNKSSVLYNLLNSGKDSSYGYEVGKKANREPLATPSKIKEPKLQEKEQPKLLKVKSTSLLSLLQPAAIQQLIQIQLDTSGNGGGIPIQLVLPK